MKKWRNVLSAMLAAIMLFPSAAVAQAANVSLEESAIVGSAGWDIRLIYEGETVTPRLVMNNPGDDLSSVVVYAAAYDGQQLQAVASKTITVISGQSEYFGPAIKIADLPEDFGLKVFVWKAGDQGLAPIGDPYVYDEAKAFEGDSQNEVDAREFVNADSKRPFDGDAQPLVLTTASVAQAEPVKTMSLDGEWEMVQDGSEILLGSVYADSAVSAAEYAVDGNAETGWQSANTAGTHEISVDLGGFYAVRKVVLTHSAEAGETTDSFAVQYSADGQVWSDGDSVTGNTDAVTTHLMNSTARYIKVVISKASDSGNTARLNEIEVYVGQLSSSSTLIQGAIVTTDSVFGNFVPENLVDGAWAVEDTDEWVSNGDTDEHWAVLDFGEPKRLSMVKIYHGGLQAVHYTKDFVLQGSNDNSQWTNLTARITGNNDAITTHTFEPAEYRYLRFYIYDPCETDSFARVYEIEAYEQAAASHARVTDVDIEVDSEFSNGTVTFVKENLIDGAWTVEETDEWVSTGETDEHYAILDLKQQLPVTMIRLRQKEHWQAAAFTIEGSNDKLDWDVLHRETNNTSYVTEINELDATYRYIKLHITKPTPASSTDKFARIYELEVYTTADQESTWQKINLQGGWMNAMPAQVPGSIHTALYENGVIPHPYIGRNSIQAKEMGNHHYWLRKTFTKMEGEGQRLVFDGVCNKADFYVNGTFVGSHEGMFTQFSYELDSLLHEGENNVIVHLYPTLPWDQTVVFNNSYGWHYLDMPPLGIWENVHIDATPEVEIEHPYIVTMDTDGTMRLTMDLKGKEAVSGVLSGAIVPKNFEGTPQYFSVPVTSSETTETLLYEFTIANPQLWWPNDYGDQNLYTLQLSFVPEGGGRSDYTETDFGIRTVKQLPTAFGQAQMPWLGANIQSYDWILEINGVRVPIKGANWCTMDGMMNFTYEKYDRFMSLAKSQHINFLRLWGSGMVETDEMYDLCNQYGIMLLQEWPTAWDSDKIQPQDLLTETVEQGILRLRNNPSLVMYGGGNESGNPNGPMITMMGNRAYELDGTRVFHRSEAGGGSGHNYTVYWGGAPLDYNLGFQKEFKLIFIGEFGAASVPNVETVYKYLPEDEKNVWPVGNDSSFAYKTPTFNVLRGYGLDLQLLTQYSNYFTPGDTLENFVIGSQLSHAVADRYAMEQARIFFPTSAGVAYYKISDNNPAASWACIDFYGVPKIPHYFFQDSYAPLCALVKFDSLNPGKRDLSLPVYLLDDTDALKDSDWSVTTSVYNTDLEVVASMENEGHGSIGYVLNLGNIEVPASKMNESPMFVVTDTMKDGKLVQRIYYFINYEKYNNSLFTMLPATTLSYSGMENGEVTITNTGDKPAVAVHFNPGEQSNVFTCEDNYFWLNAGESVTLDVSMDDGSSLADVTATAWNIYDENGEKPAAPATVQAPVADFNKVKIEWSAVDGIAGYAVYRDSELVGVMGPESIGTFDRDVAPETTYTYTVQSIGKNGLRSEKAMVQVITGEEIITPQIVTLKSATENKLEVAFNMPLQGTDVLANYTLEGGAITNILTRADGAVVLTTEALTPGKTYTLKVQNVTTEAGEPVTIQRTFENRLIGWWQFDDTNDDDVTAYDSSGFGLHGTKTSGEFADGISGSAFSATADSSQYVTTEPSNTSLADGVTVAGWVNIPEKSKSGFNVLFSKGPKEDGHFEVYLTGGALYMYAPEIGDIASGYTFSCDGTWHHVAVTINRSNVAFYVDGNVVSTQSTGGKYLSDKGFYYEINGFGKGTFARAGKFDEFRLYNAALTAADIQRIYTAK